MNVFTITIPSTQQPRTLVYTVKIRGYNNLWTTVFTGKVYVMNGQTKVNIDLEDILWNYKFDGENYFAPALNQTGDNYIICNTSNTLQNYWYNRVRVEFPTLPNTPYVEKYVKFFKYNMFDREIDEVSNGTVALFMNTNQPVAHIPANPPEGFFYRQLVWNGSFTKNIDGRTSVVQRNNLGVITFSGGTKQYSLNNRVIAIIDSCPKPYYLVYLTNEGGLQCQPFLKSSELNISYKNNTRVDNSDFEWVFNQQTRAKWNLKSRNLTDSEYKAMGDIFNSPYVALLDMENHRFHWVNVTKETYTQKRNENGKKPIFFEIEVQSSEIKVI